MSARTWVKEQDWLLWGAVGFALVGTAHAEYTLAVATGVNQWVALALPGALDLYVVRAIRSGRDVFAAVLAMVAANVAAHLVNANVLAVDWKLISAVGAVAPLIVWRVYALRRTRTRTELLWDVKAGEVSDLPYPEYDPYPVTGTGRVRECMDPEECQVNGPCPECDPRVTTSPAYSWDADYLPEGWVTEYVASEVAGEPGTDPVSANPSDRVTDSPAPDTVPASHLAQVIPLPPGYAPSEATGTEDASHLKTGDHEYLGSLSAYLETVEELGTRVSVKGCKEFCRVGQERAQRLLRHAGYPKEAGS